MCVGLLCLIHLSLELVASRDWYQRVWVDSSALVPVVMGGRVCQGQCERPLCSGAAAWYEREDWRPTWIQTCDWARSRKPLSPTALCQFWLACAAPLSLPVSNEGLSFSSPRIKHEEQISQPVMVTGALVCVATPEATCRPAGLLRRHPVQAEALSVCLFS